MKERWKNYFLKLYNKNLVRGTWLDDTSFSRDILYYFRITELKVNKAWRKWEQKVGTADNIANEVWNIPEE